MTADSFLQNRGTFNYYSGDFLGRLLNLRHGRINFFADFTAENGLINYSRHTVEIPYGITVTLNTLNTGDNFGLDNFGKIFLNGGTLASNNGLLLNDCRGRFFGWGEIDGVFVNSGKLSPFNPNNFGGVGELDIYGSFEQTCCGKVKFDIASEFDYDRIDVEGTPGTATLAGTVWPHLVECYHPRGSRYFDVIHADGGVFGTFDRVKHPFITLTLNWEPVYRPYDFYLLTRRNYTHAWLGLNSNQTSVGNMLNSVAMVHSGDLDDVLNVIDYLNNTGAIQDAFKQISPEKTAALANIAFAGATNQMRNLAERITNIRFGSREAASAGTGGPGSFNLSANPFSGVMLAYNSSSLSGLLTGQKEVGPLAKWGLFIDPNLILGSRGSSANLSGYDFTTAGFSVGADCQVQDNLIVGLASGYNHTDAGFHGVGGSVTNNSWPITAYAAYLPEKFYVFGSLGYTLNLFDLERNIAFGSIARKAQSSPTGNQLNIYAETGYDLKVKRLVVTPTVSLAYTNLWLDGFTEDGAGALNLRVASQSAASVQTGVGGKVSLPIKRGDHTIVPQVYATYQHEFSNDARGLDARLSQGSATCTWQTDKAARDFAVVGGNLTVGIKKNLAAQANYNVELGKGKEINHFLNIGVRYQF